MTTPGHYTFDEITSQPRAWTEALATFSRQEAAVKTAWTRVQPRQILVAGCGSTHYLALTAAALLQRLSGSPARAYPSSEIVLFPEQVLLAPADTLLLTISRSGTTTETLQAVEVFRQRGGRTVWAITCHPESPLAAAADLTLAVEAGQEQSVAQTRSFASMLVVVQLLAAALSGRDAGPAQRLPQIGAALIAETDSLMQELGGRAELERFYFLGSGSLYGVASEAMLKMTEMSLTHSQAFHFLEFRHGPMSMAGPEALIIGLLSGTASHQERLVLEEMAGLGAPTLALSAAATSLQTTWTVALDERMPAWATPVLALPPLQLLAYYRALAKGLDPDNPRHLAAVILLDGAPFA